MSDEVPSHFIDLVQDAMLKSFWRKNTLVNFLRRHKISENFLGSWQETETKRMFVARLLPKLEAHAKGDQILKQMAISLADQLKFPDLEGWEDTKEKIQSAREAVQSLRSYLEIYKQKAEEIKEREETTKVAREKLQKTIASRQTLENFSNQLTNLAKRLGTQEAGYDFQKWFYDFVNFFEITHRRPYVIDGRQIDGSVTIEGTTYLTELKFTKEQAGATDIDTLLANSFSEISSSRPEPIRSPEHGL